MDFGLFFLGQGDAFLEAQVSGLTEADKEVANGMFVKFFKSIDWNVNWVCTDLLHAEPVR